MQVKFIKPLYMLVNTLLLRHSKLGIVHVMLLLTSFGLKIEHVNSYET